MDMKDWKLWIILAATLAAVILGFVYPYQPQRQEVLQQYQNMQDNEIIDVVVQIEDKNQALQYIAMKYDGYTVIEEYYLPNKKSWFFRLQKVGETNE